MNIKQISGAVKKFANTDQIANGVAIYSTLDMVAIALKKMTQAMVTWRV
jgi:hypothetical protein